MSTNQFRPEHNHAETSERSLARLLKLSGERETPSAEATARAHAAALETWQDSLWKVRATRIRYVLSGLAAAFSIALVGAIMLTSTTQQTTPVSVAYIVGLSAPATLIDPNGGRSEANIGTPIATSAQLQTRTGRGSLRIGESLSLRIDTNTQLRFVGPSHVRLLAGAVYVDSGGLNAASNLRILTPAGEVHHEGTQYQVRVHGELTHIKVREGRVQLLATRNGGVMSIIAGEQIRIDDGDVSKSSVPIFGPDWDWASSMASSIDIDNRPLIEFLAWITREHGWQLRYASPTEERAVQSIRLHGSAMGNTPADTLRRVSLITGLSMQVDNGILLVGPGREQQR